MQLFIRKNNNKENIQNIQNVLQTNGQNRKKGTSNNLYFFIVATRVVSKNYRPCCTPRSRKSSRRGGITFQKELIGHR